MSRHAELLVARIGSLDRCGLIQELRRMRCSFEIDFSDDFLNSVSLERLRHIVLAAGLHAHAPAPEVASS